MTPDPLKRHFRRWLKMNATCVENVRLLEILEMQPVDTSKAKMEMVAIRERHILARRTDREVILALTRL